MTLTRRQFTMLVPGAFAGCAIPRFASAAVPQAATGANDVTMLTLAEASRRLRAGAVTSMQLTEACLARIATYDPKLDAFTYDVGAEFRAPKLIGGNAISLSPFAGIGAGGRSYNYRSLSAPATSNVAGYGSVGGELGVGRIRLRLEARDYLTGFRPLAGEGATRSGNDVVLMGGLRFVRR